MTATATADIEWLITDQLGTPRMIADKTGSLAGVKRHDYLPFGEEVSAGTGNRTNTQGYTADSLRQQFTGKERDAETNLDYFGARFYSGTQGRFTGVDPGPFTATDPQSFNRYSYVQNNPLKFLDPTGETLVILGEGADEFVRELEIASGFKLNRDAKTGVVTIAKRDASKATSKKLAKMLEKTIQPKATVKDKDTGKNKDIDFTVTINLVKDQDKDGVDVFFDQFSSKSLDTNDYAALKKDAHYWPR